MHQKADEVMTRTKQLNCLFKCKLQMFLFSTSGNTLNVLFLWHFNNRLISMAFILDIWKTDSIPVRFRVAAVNFYPQLFLNFLLCKPQARPPAHRRIKSYLMQLAASHMLTTTSFTFIPLSLPYPIFLYSSRSPTNSRHLSASERCPMGVQSATSATTTGTCTHTWQASTKRM